MTRIKQAAKGVAKRSADTDSSGAIDTFVHHTWRSQQELMAYLPRAWRELIGQPGAFPDGGGMMPVIPAEVYRNPLGDKLSDGGISVLASPGADTQAVINYIESSGTSRAILGFDDAMRIPSHPNPYAAIELSRAANDWSLERWIGLDSRFYGLAIVPNQSVEAAVAEIRRLGSNPKIVGILMGANGIGKPFGHPVYHPIYAEAALHGFPVVIHVGSDSPIDCLTQTTAGGPPVTYAEYRLLSVHPLMTHVISMIVHGVFDTHADLRVYLVGAGVTWVPSLVWRLDNDYKALRREVTWLKRPPSDYFRENVRVSTYAMDVAPSLESLHSVLQATGGLDEMICFASGYPNWDADHPAKVAGVLPRLWRPAVLRNNALDLFRWPSPAVGIGASE